MFSNIRSLIFKLDPETAHNLAIKSLKFNFVPNFTDEYKDDPLFKTKLFNQDIENPIGMAAGFDKNAEVYNSLFKLGFGFVEAGTITPLKQYGNPKPRVFRLVEDEALINRLGFNNFGAKNIVKRVQSNKQIGLLGINIGPNKDTKDRTSDYIECLKTHGFLKGSVLGLKRILSCHPIKILGGGSGLDTVPVNKETIKENK